MHLIKLGIKLRYPTFPLNLSSSFVGWLRLPLSASFFIKKIYLGQANPHLIAPGIRNSSIEFERHFTDDSLKDHL
jgi:hypothetical protein